MRCCFSFKSLEFFALWNIDQNCLILTKRNCWKIVDSCRVIGSSARSSCSTALSSGFVLRVKSARAKTPSCRLVACAYTRSFLSKAESRAPSRLSCDSDPRINRSLLTRPSTLNLEVKFLFRELARLPICSFYLRVVFFHVGVILKFTENFQFVPIIEEPVESFVNDFCCQIRKSVLCIFKIPKNKDRDVKWHLFSSHRFLW